MQHVVDQLTFKVPMKKPLKHEKKWVLQPRNELILRNELEKRFFNANRAG